VKDLGDFDLLICDESHFMKSLTAKRTEAILGVGGHIRRSKRMWAVSGTPAPNHIGELWPILYTFGATHLQYPAFIDRFCNSYEWQRGRVVTGTKLTMVPEIKQLLNKVMLRRKKEEVMKELPEIFFQDVVVAPGEVDIDTDDVLVKYVFPRDRREELNEIINTQTQLVKSTLDATGFTKDGMRALEALARSVSTLRMYTGLQKVQSVADIIASELSANAYDKIVLFAVHKNVVEGLRLRLREFGAVTLYGNTNPKTRQENIDSFQKDPKTRVFIGNIQSAGTAITLTAAHQVGFVEQEWTPAAMAQAAMRCHRIGQNRTVFVRFFSLSNSIDEKISAALKRKTRELTEIFDAN
jgi:SNF2 family DNA or RNA helicase